MPAVREGINIYMSWCSGDILQL